MANLKKIKNQINAISKTRQITNAMYQIATSKIKKSEQSLLNFQVFDQEFMKVFNLITERKSDFFNFKYDAHGNKLYILIGQDRGLCGAYHNRLFKYAESVIPSDNNEVFLLTIGRKPFYYFSKSKKYNIVNDVPILNKDDLSLFNLEQTSIHINNLFEKSFISGVYLIYNEVISAADFKPVMLRVFPLTEKSKKINKVDTYEIDANVPVMAQQLLQTYLESQIYKALINAKKTEHAARMMAMRNASDNSRKITDKLQLKYHRMRQQAITNELIDIVAGGKE